MFMDDTLPMTVEFQPEWNPDAEVGELIQIVMRWDRVTQGDVARALGLSQSSVSGKLHGKTPWTLRELHIVARMLRVSVEELVAIPSPKELRACRDSNPKPSVLERPRLRLVRGGRSVKPRLTVLGPVAECRTTRPGEAS